MNAWWGLVSLLALACVVPSVAAQSGVDPDGHAGDPRVLVDGAECFEARPDERGAVCTVMYAHLFHPLLDGLMNLQRPDDCLQESHQTGYTVLGVEGLWDLNEVDLAATPSWINYRGCEDTPHNYGWTELTSPVRLDPSLPLVGYWYLAADPTEVNPLGADPDAPEVGAAPCLTVRMILFDGRFRGDDVSRPVLARGETIKTLLTAPADAAGPVESPVPCPGAGAADVMHPQDVTEFRVPLVAVDTSSEVTAQRSLGLRVEWYTWAPGDPDEPNKVYPTGIEQWYGPEHVNRIVFAASSTLSMSTPQPFAFEDQIAAAFEVSSLWGSYDVDMSSIRLAVADEEGTAVPIGAQPTIEGRRSIDHHALADAATVYLLWDVLAEDFAPGRYTATLSVLNHQHTASAAQSFDFYIDRSGGFLLPPDPTLHGAAQRADTPAVALGPAVAFVLAGVWVAARLPGSLFHVHKNVK